MEEENEDVWAQIFGEIFGSASKKKRNSKKAKGFWDHFVDFEFTVSEDEIFGEDRKKTNNNNKKKKKKNGNDNDNNNTTEKKAKKPKSFDDYVKEKREKKEKVVKQREQRSKLSDKDNIYVLLPSSLTFIINHYHHRHH